MGSIGGIEKMMVFGILVIIVAILGIAFYSAIKVEDDLTPHRLKAKGEDDPIKIIDPSVADDDEPGEAQGGDNPIIEDVPFSLLSNLNSRESLKLDNPLAREGEGEGTAGRVGPLDRSQGAGDAGKAGGDTDVSDKKFENYTVQPGDSFRRIARIRLGDEERYVEIEALNPGVDPLRLQIGQVLQLPVADPAVAKKPEKAEGPSDPVKEGANLYKVKAGDTLIKISRKIYGNGTGWKKIYNANRDVIPNPDVLAVGTVLKIPE